MYFIWLGPQMWFRQCSIL